MDIKIKAMNETAIWRVMKLMWSDVMQSTPVFVNLFELFNIMLTKALFIVLKQY